MTNPNRVKAGVPNGGQFAAQQHSEPGNVLSVVATSDGEWGELGYSEEETQFLRGQLMDPEEALRVPDSTDVTDDPEAVVVDLDTGTVLVDGVVAVKDFPDGAVDEWSDDDMSDWAAQNGSHLFTSSRNDDPAESTGDACATVVDVGTGTIVGSNVVTVRNIPAFVMDGSDSEISDFASEHGRQLFLEHSQ